MPAYQRARKPSKSPTISRAPRSRSDVDLAAVFVLSLLGGYYFFYFWRLTAVGTRRSEGHHLYFRAALGGAALFVLAFIIRILLLAYWNGYESFDSALVEYVKPVLKDESGVPASAPNGENIRRAQWVVTAGYSLFLGIFAAALLNVFTSRKTALERSLGPLDRLLWEAQLADLPVCFTLNNRKTYIGLVQATPDPSRVPSTVTVLPMFSGHRDDQGRMVLTTDYQTLYTALDAGRADDLRLPTDWLSQFQMVIPAETIVTASLFSPVIYAEFNPSWKQQIVEQNQKPPPQELLVEIREPKIPPWKQRRD
jgi:hypothetical protein